MKLTTVAILLLSLSFYASGKETIVVWKHNYEHPFFLEILQNAISKAEPEIGEYDIVPSAQMSVSEAFEALRKGEIDVFIGGPNVDREQQAKVIYVPLDRGLLGFRVCMVKENTPPLVNIAGANDVIEKKISIGVGEAWVDRYVYQNAGFEVITSPSFPDLFSMLREGEFDCFSRSVNEIDTEIAKQQNEGLKSDQNILFVYPNSAFMFVNPHKPELHQNLSIGIGRSIEDYDFYEIFDKHYANILIQHGIYERKLVFLENTQISPRALWSINRFGIASFVMGPIQPLTFDDFSE